MSTATEKIIATIPASGWRVTFSEKDASDPVEHEVIAWQLIELDYDDGEGRFQKWVGVAVWENGPERCDMFTDHTGYEPIEGWQPITKPGGIRYKMGDPT